MLARRLSQLVFILVTGILLMRGANAQQPTVPAVVPINGVLQDTAGQPLSGVQSVTFALYQQQTGGTALWMETQNVTADAQGYFSALLGSTRSEGLPEEFFSSKEARWLGVQVNQPGQAEQPRVLLVTVPYALKAADADTLGGLPASAFLLNSDQVTQRVQQSGGIMGQPTSGPFTGNASGTGTQGNLALWTDNAGTLGNAAFFQSGNNIGLGTTLPATLLHIAKDSTYTNSSTAALTISSATTPALRMLFGYDPAVGNPYIQSLQEGVDVKPLLLNPLGGSVGLGITAPQAILHVAQDSTYLSDLAAGLLVGSRSTPAKRIMFGYDANIDAGYMQSTQTGVGVKPLIINPIGGAVAIGKTTATQPLEVNGNIASSGTVSANLFSGSGASLTSLNASDISSGLLGPVFGGTGLSNCATGQTLSWNGSAWSCATPAVGTVAGQPVLNLQPGTDVTAELQSAIDNCGALCTLALPAGSYFIGDIVIRNQISLRIVGTGEATTVLNYISSGTAFQTIPQTGRIPISFEDMKLVALHTGANAIKLAFVGPATVRHVWFTGFAGNIWITGNGAGAASPDQSVGAWIDDARIENITGDGAFAISLDHVADVYIDSLQGYTTTDDTMATQLIIDQGAQGIYINHSVMIGGQHSLVIRSTGQGGAYGIVPSAIHCVSSYFDSTTGGSAIIFDSSLGTNVMRTMFSNCWAGGGGIRTSVPGVAAIATANASGLVIAGGQDIQWNGGVIRQNAANGVLITGNQPLDVFQITGARILANNVANADTASGILVNNPNATHISIIGNIIGNLAEGKGHQKYGIAFAEAPSSTNVIAGNSADANEVSDYFGVSGCTFCGPQQSFFAGLGKPPDGTQEFCPDCTVAQPAACVNATTPAACMCSAGGGGAIAKRISGTWLCY